MKLTIDQKSLADAAAWVSRSLPARPTVPILAGIVLTAEGDGALTLSAFDYDVSARITVDAAVGEPGSVLVSGRVFTNVVKSLSGKNPVRIETPDDHHLSIKSGPSEFSAALMPGDEYPKLPDLPPAMGEISAAAFRSAILAIGHCASSEETLPALTCICISPTKDSLVLAATDRFRLGVATIPWEPSTADFAYVQMLVPAPALTDFARGLDDGMVSFSWQVDGPAGGLVAFTSGKREITTRTIGADFPKYERLVPPNFTTAVTFDPEDLAAATKRVGQAADRGQPVKLAIGPDDIALNAGDEATLLGLDVVDAKLNGDPITVAFNPHYLVDALAHIDGPARISLTTSGKPGLISVDVDHAPTFVLLMPIRPANA